MASSFNLFRRHQKILLAALAVLAIIAFTLSDVFRLGGGASGSESRDVVRAMGKTYSEAELQQLVDVRRDVYSFLSGLVAAGVRKSNEQSGGNLDERLLELQRRYQMRLVDEEFHRVGSNASAQAIETLILADKAERAGIVVSNGAINQFLDRITERRVDTPDTLKLLEEMGRRDRHLNQQTLFKALRTELMAARYLRTFQTSIANLTPAQRFDYYRRLHRFASVEMLPVNVSDFVDRVKNPTDDELQAYYQEHRDTVAAPGSPEPGFKRPRKASFQYFVAALENFEQQSDVSEEEIRSFYEKNKERYIKLDLPDEPAEKPKDDKQPAGEAKPAGEATPAPEKPAEDAKPDSPAKEKPTEPAPKSDAAAEKPADAPTKPDEPGKKEESKPADAPGKSAARGDGAKLRRVSFLQTETKADESAKTDTKSEPAAAPVAGTSKPADADKPVDKPADAPDGKPGDQPKDAPAEKPADKPSDAAADKPAEKPTDKPADQPADKPDDQPAGTPAAKPADSQASSEPKPRQYQSLDSVRSEIRKQLAREKAEKVIEKIFNELQEALAEYRGRRTRLESEQGDVKQYPPFDLAKFATEKGVGAWTTELLSEYKLSEEVIGKSQFTVPTPNSPLGFQSIPFHRWAFSSYMPTLFQPVVTTGAGEQYLVWKTAEAPALVPTFATVRRDVLNSWKFAQARSLAREHAERLAERARKSKQALVEEFGKKENKQVLLPAEFTWLTRGNVPSGLDAAPRLSAIEGIEEVSDDFMRSIFSLAPGEVTVAVDVAQAKYYVVRLKRFRPFEEDLKESFASEDFRKYIDAAQVDFYRLQQTWLAALEKEAGVEWLRAPRQQSEEQ